jgi:fumarate hydratase subunit beta
MEINSKCLNTPLPVSSIKNLHPGDFISITGIIYTGRDAALPKLVQDIRSGHQDLDLEGAVIMHTAVSPAGIAPTTSNKEEIQENIGPLSKAGVRIHIGKGSLSPKTIIELEKNKSIFVVTPPAAALLTSKMESSEIVAYPEEGMEALYRLSVRDFPGIVAVAHGKTIY